MRKLFFLSFLFLMVACYAGPPPVPDDCTSDQIHFTICDFDAVTVQSVDLEAIIFTCKSDFEIFHSSRKAPFTVQDYQLHSIWLPENIPVPIATRNKSSENQNNPPGNLNDYTALLDMQNSNYGYPFSANKCYTIFNLFSYIASSFFAKLQEY